MKEFQMCKTCTKEYIDPYNRRFHAQTVACNKCGPYVYLCDSSGELLDSKDPIRDTGKLLEDGSIVAIKGNGGFHIASATTKSEPIVRLRKDKYRKQKPLALMSPNLSTIQSFAELNNWQCELLCSYRKPIILLKKSEEYYLSSLVSPGLNSVGVMLPYTGLHAMLFDNTNEPAFVMTSANPPSEPIIIKNFDAIEKLSSTVDYFLFHNRLIVQRCDDSVVRFHGNNPCLIRRSRGYAPEPIILQKDSYQSVLALGGELNVTSCVLTDNKAFISQHIGNVENLGNLYFLKDSVEHLLKLINSKIEGVACDFHPNFATTRLAKYLAKKFDCQVIQVQHHHAHSAALMAEWNVEEVVAITCDGFGYGSDRTAWGGEILYCNFDGFERVAHLENQPMIGGDLATYYPLRMALGILYGKVDLTNWLFKLSKKFPYGEKEVDLIINQLKKGTAPKTSSCGRILDSISAILEICYERTYEGEPAMKLESIATKGKDILNLGPKYCGNTLDTTFLVKEIFINKDNISKADLAFSAESYLARGLAQLAIKEAERLKVKNIGFSGGVAYNEHITSEIQTNVENAGFKFLFHKKIPAGDGGTSFGQAIVVGFKI
jgi:hydrogenase maturation protein HypF